MSSRETRRQAERSDHRGNPVSPLTGDFFKPKDLIVLESGSSNSGTFPLPLPDGAEVQTAPLWGSIGWATGAALGVALADPSRRTILVTGDGSHQLTVTAIGTMGRYGLKPIIFVLNNDGYMVERAARAGSELGLQRPRPLELSCSSRRPGLPGMVHGQGHHAR